MGVILTWRGRELVPEFGGNDWESGFYSAVFCQVQFEQDDYGFKAAFDILHTNGEIIDIEKIRWLSAFDMLWSISSERHSHLSSPPADHDHHSLICIRILSFAFIFFSSFFSVMSSLTPLSLVFSPCVIIYFYFFLVLLLFPPLL